jgi:hypothetical protein
MSKPPQKEEVMMTTEEALQKLFEAVAAMEGPTSILEGPLTDGPEMDEVNAVMAEIRSTCPFKWIR